MSENHHQHIDLDDEGRLVATADLQTDPQSGVGARSSTSSLVTSGPVPVVDSSTPSLLGSHHVRSSDWWRRCLPVRPRCWNDSGNGARTCGSGRPERP